MEVCQETQQMAKEKWNTVIKGRKSFYLARTSPDLQKIPSDLTHLKYGLRLD